MPGSVVQICGANSEQTLPTALFVLATATTALGVFLVIMGKLQCASVVQVCYYPLTILTILTILTTLFTPPMLIGPDCTPLPLPEYPSPPPTTLAVYSFCPCQSSGATWHSSASSAAKRG